MVRCWKVVDVNQESNGLRTEPCGTPAFRVDLGREQTVDVDLYDTANQKVREPTCHFAGKSSWNILYLSPLCQTLSKAFSTSRKTATTCSPQLKLSMTDWDSLKRWSSVGLA